MFAAKYWSRLSLSSAQENWDIGEDVSFHCGLGSTERKAHDGHLKALLINLLGHGFSFTCKNSISRHLVVARHENRRSCRKKLSLFSARFDATCLVIRSACAATQPCWPHLHPAPWCWPSSSNATLSLGWFWPWRCTPPPTHRTDLPTRRDRPSAQGDQQSRRAAASLANLSQNKLPLLLLCLLVSQPTRLGERLQLSRLFARATIFICCLFVRLASSVCVLRSANSGGGTPKIHRSLARNAPAQIRSENPRILIRRIA